MPQRVTLDAMIPREDFSVVQEEFELELIRDMPISNLADDSPILRLLRKPDFQRETNHWTPEQIATFIASFLDNEVIPSLILWKSPRFIFVIDGGHRLSALRAWVEDDYGDGNLSIAFYKGEISDEQKRIARRTRQLVEREIGRYTKLRGLVDAKSLDEANTLKRANRLFTRPLTLQWIQGNAEVAETSFFKINSQGTPLDSTEEVLIKNRRKPIAIAARAIIRSGTGHKYWSAFAPEQIRRIEELANETFDLLFEPESSLPLRTLDVPLGGSVSPVDALSLLTELLSVAGNRLPQAIPLERTEADENGDATILVFKRSLEIIKRVTGNAPGSLGLHPAIYFYNERGKYSRFLFLGMITLLTDHVRNNDSGFFRTFTNSRQYVEQFLVENKSAITLVLQNMSKKQRVPQMTKLFRYLIATADLESSAPSLQSAMEALGLRGKILDLTKNQQPTHFTDDAKSMLFIETAIRAALKCPICNGYLNPAKSISYDHIQRRREGGDGSVANGQLVHPFCNTGMKN